MTLLSRRPRLFALVAAGIVVGLVLAATGLGLRLPGLGFLDLSADRTRLDYQSRYIEGFTPLRGAFVDARLGLLDTGRPAASGSRGPSAIGSLEPRVSVEHAATNDHFADAYVVPSVPFTAKTSTTKATREQGEPKSCSPAGGTVWYTYTPVRDVTLVSDTFGTRYSDALAVFSGRRLTALRSRGCDVGATGGAQVTFRAREGERYFFQISGVTGGGPLTFSLQPLGATTRLDASEAGEATQPLDFRDPAVSGDGRYVAFISSSRALGCPERGVCLYVRDLVGRKVTRLVSAGYVSEIDISADGRYVGFMSGDSDLVPNDTNGAFGRFDVFVVDRVTRKIERVSVSSTGAQAHTDPVFNDRWPASPGSVTGSFFPSLSSDGRFVSFESDADNLDPRATDGRSYMYVHDRVTGHTELVSVDGRDRPMAAFNRNGRAISGDGRYAVFYGAPGDAPNGVFLHDRLAGTTTSVGVVGGSYPVISNDGSHIAEIRSEENGAWYVYVYDVADRRVTLASVSSAGRREGSRSTSGVVGSPGTSTYPRVSISANGRFVTFDSYSPTLTPHDGNGVDDVFVRDLVNRTTVLVSVRSDGSQFTADSYYPSISGDGRVVAFLNDSADRYTFAHVSVVAGRP